MEGGSDKETKRYQKEDVGELLLRLKDLGARLGMEKVSLRDRTLYYVRIFLCDCIDKKWLVAML
jgi:hypothetical protein